MVNKTISYFIILMLLFSCQRNDKNDGTDNPEAANDHREQQKTQTFILDSLLQFDSEKELMENYGSDIARGEGYYPEGMGKYQNTLLYPNTNNEVEFVWKDDSIGFRGLDNIRIKEEGSQWKTREGITIGTSLIELEALNEKPFIFYGFGWDYAGTVLWNDGSLQDRVFIRLKFPGENVPPKELTGERQVRSDSKIARQINPVVRELIMKKN